MSDRQETEARVYLVEDHSLMRESLRARLEMEANIEVVGETDDAEHALVELQSLDVDVVLMDIGLPGMDGIEATRQIKQQTQNIFVLMLTSYEDEYVEQAIEAGASGYILKTSTGQQLTQSVHAVHQGQSFLDPSLTGRLFEQVAELRKSNKQSLLTDRQVEILRLVAGGTRYKEVASKLDSLVKSLCRSN